MECFLKAKLKMALAGKAKVTADFADAFICKSQQCLAFFQFAAIDIFI